MAPVMLKVIPRKYKNTYEFSIIPQRRKDVLNPSSQKTNIMIMSFHFVRSQLTRLSYNRSLGADRAKTLIWNNWMGWDGVQTAIWILKESM